MIPLYHLLLLTFLPSSLASSCKSHPDSPSWPSPKTWSQLNTTLNGALLAPIPPGAVCHASQPTYNKNTCPKVAKAWKTYDFHTENPVSLIYDQYSNWTCLPDKDYPCSGEGYPAYVINVRKAEDVKVGIDFGKHSHTVCRVMRCDTNGIQRESTISD